jgi:hypothetical protein
MKFAPVVLLIMQCCLIGLSISVLAGEEVTQVEIGIHSACICVNVVFGAINLKIFTT